MTNASQENKGSLRAYTAVILLTLYRYGEIDDAAGSALRELLTKARIPTVTTPQGASNALHRLRDNGFVVTDTCQTRTYGIRLKQDLRETTIDALKRDEQWARAFICKEKPLPAVSWSPPVIEFAEDGDVHPKVDEVDYAVELPSMDTDGPAVNGHVDHHANGQGGFSVPLDTAVLMRIIAEQAKTIKSLREELGHHVEDSVGSEVGEFLMALL